MVVFAVGLLGGIAVGAGLMYIYMEWGGSRKKNSAGFRRRNRRGFPPCVSSTEHAARRFYVYMMPPALSRPECRYDIFAAYFRDARGADVSLPEKVRVSKCVPA